MTESEQSHFSPTIRYSQKESGKIQGIHTPSYRSPFSNASAPKRDQTDIPRKAVICFQCGLISSVPQAALSTRCHHCSAYLNLDDIILHQRSYKTLIQTRGNVSVKPDTELKGITIHCHNLYMKGKVSGYFNCSGTCYVKKSQQISGSLRSHSLVVFKKATVSFTKPIEVQHAHIRGEFYGKIIADGTVYIAKGGKILGDITSQNLIIEEGGEHSGYYKKLSL